MELTCNVIISRVLLKVHVGKEISIKSKQFNLLKRIPHENNQNTIGD